MPHRHLKAFVVEDDRELCHAFATNLENDPNIQAVEAHDLPDAVRLCRAEPQVVLLVDLGLPSAKGLEAVTRLRTELPSATLIVITGRDEMHGPALAAGAHAVIEKAGPQSFGSELIAAVRRAVVAHDIELLFRPAREGLDQTEKAVTRAAEAAGRLAAPLVLFLASLILWCRSEAAAAETLRDRNDLRALVSEYQPEAWERLDRKSEGL